MCTCLNPWTDRVPEVNEAPDIDQVPENEHGPIEFWCAEQPELARSQSGSSETSPGPLQTWVKYDSYIAQMPVPGKQGPLCNSVKRRVVTDVETGTVLADEAINPQGATPSASIPSPKR